MRGGADTQLGATKRTVWPRVECMQIRCLAGTFGLSRSPCPHFREFDDLRAKFMLTEPEEPVLSPKSKYAQSNASEKSLSLPLHLRAGLQ